MRLPALAVLALLVAGCMGGAPAPSGPAPAGEWEPTGQGSYRRAAGLDVEALRPAHGGHTTFAMDLPEFGRVDVHAMPHAEATLESWARAAGGWEPARVQSLAWGHGRLVGYGYDGGGPDRDSSLELMAAPAGWYGVVGVVDESGERLVTLWVEEGASGVPEQRALVERTHCHRPDDYQWIYGCGSRPVDEGRVGPVVT